MTIASIAALSDLPCAAERAASILSDSKLFTISIVSAAPISFHAE
jgi:hypothetical protein